MSRYINNDASSPIAGIEIASGSAGGVMALYGREGEGPEALQDILKQKFPDLAVVTSSGSRNKPMLLASGVIDEEKALSTLRSGGEDGGGFTKDETAEQKKSHKKEHTIFGMKMGLMQIRGWLGNLGQIFIWIGSKKEVDLGFMKFKGGLKPNDKKKAGTMYSIVANAISMVFGSQKKEDTPREKFVKQHINKGLAIELGPEVKLPFPHQKQLAARHDLPPKTLVDGTKDLFLGNTMRISQFLKMIGKGKLAEGGKETGVTGVKLSGQLSQIAKVISIVGKDEDPFHVEGKKGMLTWLREKSNFFSGALEWTANLSGLFGSVFEDDTRPEAKALKKQAMIKIYNPLTGDRIPRHC